MSGSVIGALMPQIQAVSRPAVVGDKKKRNAKLAAQLMKRKVAGKDGKANVGTDFYPS